MTDLTFQMLLQCQYSGTDNHIEQLHVEHLVDSDWQVLDLNTYTPGFDIFMYAILTCQHMYFRMNAAERGLIMGSSEGLITINADEHRSIKTLHVDFKGQLTSGTVTADAISFISQRMKQCPVSINLKKIMDSKISITFESA